MIKKLDPKLVEKEINQIAVFKGNRLMVHDLLILDYETFTSISIHRSWFGFNI